ncbi:MAG TPA: hypothetical protein DCL60_05020 [Armatimonadetes bacterium]|nr:hypothetical protein [Armatimonadota bacterium]
MKTADLLNSCLLYACLVVYLASFLYVLMGFAARTWVIPFKIKRMLRYIEKTPSKFFDSLSINKKSK